METFADYRSHWSDAGLSIRLSFESVPFSDRYGCGHVKCMISERKPTLGRKKKKTGKSRTKKNPGFLDFCLPCYVRLQLQLKTTLSTIQSLFRSCLHAPGKHYRHVTRQYHKTSGYWSSLPSDPSANASEWWRVTGPWDQNADLSQSEDRHLYAKKVDNLMRTRRVVAESYLFNWCSKPSQPQRIISGMWTTFTKRYIVERTNRAETRP